MESISPKIIISAALVIGVFVMFSLAQEMNRRLQIQREVSKLEQEANDLEKKVIEMDNLNQYFRTDDFRERMAREKLNYRAEGEKVVLIPEEFEKAVVDNQEVTDVTTSSIPKLWWEAFFVTPLEG